MSKTKRLGLEKLNLDWDLAARRVRKDTRDDFWTDPLSYRDLLGGDKLPTDLYGLLDEFDPKQATSYDVPKANFTVRDSIFLPLKDRIVYQALVDRISRMLDTQLLPTVYSYRLGEPNSEYMFLPKVSQWQLFREETRRQLGMVSGSVVVVTDIARYFETIHFRKLSGQLENLLEECDASDEERSCADRCVQVILLCLNEWAPYEGFGLPQNHDASSFLGNVFLDYVDKTMAREGFPILRYMDDIRIVVDSERSARLALSRLVCCLRTLGLGLNSAKTEIVPQDSSRMEELLPGEDDEVAKIEGAIDSKDREKIQSVVDLLTEKAEGFVKDGRTHEGLFRWCLNRISILRQYRNLTISSCGSVTSAVLELFVSSPAGTDTYSSFLANAPLAQEHLDEIERLLIVEPLLVYGWQRYQLWRLLAHYRAKRPALLQLAFKVVGGDLSNPEAAAVALYMGACGEYQDRLLVKKRIYSAPPGLVRRCMQIALQELKKSERNPTYKLFRESEVESGILQDYVSGLAEPVYVDRLRSLGVEELTDAVPTMYQ